MNHHKTAKIAAAILLLATSGMANAAINEVPEPGPIGLLLAGGVALFIAKRVRKNR